MIIWLAGYDMLFLVGVTGINMEGYFIKRIRGTIFLGKRR
jgi:hypothetical protein|tara:strand:+ start:529 stop:648 length:120 start_codon:yes stop_codon:yes gene_type:complete